jgi:MFS family permease
MKYGKWNMIVATNLFILVGIAVSMVDNNIVIILGRFIFGMAAGAFSVFCPKFTSEIAPAEYRGPLGAIN